MIFKKIFSIWWAMQFLEKTERYQAYNNKSKKELIGTGIRLSHNKFFSENVLAIQIKKAYIFMNKPVYLGLSLSEILKIVRYEFCYDYVKPKYSKETKLCSMDTGSL